MYYDEQFFGTVKPPKVGISRDRFILKRFLHAALKIFSKQISWKSFFFQKNIFSRTWSFLHEWKTTNSGIIFGTKKFIFFRMLLFNFSIIFKT